MHEELDGNVMSPDRGVSLATQTTAAQANIVVSPQVVAASHEDAAVASSSATMQPPLTDFAPVVNASLVGNVSHEDAVVATSSATMKPPLTDSDPIVATSLAENVSESTSVLEKHINPRIQHDLDLWKRIKDYDKRIAEEATYTPILTRKQKQNLKKQLLDGKQPYHTRAMGPSSPQ